MLNIVTIAETQAFEGVLLLLIALAALISMLTIRKRENAARLLIYFFTCMVFLGVSRVLEGLLGGIVFVMLQDFSITLGGLFLVQFIYHYPDHDQPGEARFILGLYCLLASSSLGTIVLTGIYATENPGTFVNAPDYFWYLMPLDIALAVLLCLRRALYCHRMSDCRNSSDVFQPSSPLKILLSPPNEPTAALRNLAIAISLGAIQAIPPMIEIPYGNIRHYMIGIGGFLVVASIALVYYSHSLEPISFAARLIGIFLTVFLLFAGISGISSILDARDRQQVLARIQSHAVQLAISNSEVISPDEGPLVSYVASWPAPSDPSLTDLEIHYLHEPGSAGLLQSVRGIGGGVSDLKFGTGVSFVRMNYSDFYRTRFSQGGRVYEVGMPWQPYAMPILAEINKQITFIIISTVCILIFFPIFFRRHLFNPLNSLLAGVRRADQSDFNLDLPIWYDDEIGAITHSFNELTTSLDRSNKRRDEYHQQLISANAEMEQRVVERTKELSATNRQLLLAEDEARRTAKLEERQRLARDLHDAITQSLYGVMLFARASRDAHEIGDDSQLKQNLVEVEDNALQTLKEMRLLLHQLRPRSLEDIGLSGAINRRFEQVERRLGISASADIQSNLNLPNSVEDSIFLLATEALNNSLKHGQAASVSLSLSLHNGTVNMLIEDDGEGFDPAIPTSGMGLKNMRDRAKLLGGELEIRTGLGRGTSIHLRIPTPLEIE